MDAKLTRRTILAAAGTLVFARTSTTATTRSAMTNTASYFAYVGSRTTKERNARGEGINVYRVDAKTGRWTHVQLVKNLVNPSFLAFDRAQRFLYSVHGDLSEVSAFAVDPADGTLGFINRESTDGKNPVHLAIDPTNRFVVIANHITSTLALLPRNDDGSLGRLVDLVKLEGKIGPHRVEQPFAKPHQTVFDPSGRFILVPDKGLDRTSTFTIDAAAGKLVAGPVAVAREGAGPRHIAFHPKGQFAYVVNELDSTVAAYRFANGVLTPIQILSALPETFTGNSRAAEIEVSPDGRFVYASNRGVDNIAIFMVDQDSGRLKPVSAQPSGGKTPRFFAVAPDGAFLFVANEDSDRIVTFAVDRRSGGLRETGDGVTTGSPVCIVFKTV